SRRHFVENWKDYLWLLIGAFIGAFIWYHISSSSGAMRIAGHKLVHLRTFRRWGFGMYRFDYLTFATLSWKSPLYAIEEWGFTLLMAWGAITAVKNPQQA